RVITQLENKRREDEERRRLQEEREREARIKAEEYRIRRERQAALEGLDGDQLEDKKLELLTEAQVEAKLANFLKAKGGPTDEEKRAIVRALREARISTWEK